MVLLSSAFIAFLLYFKVNCVPIFICRTLHDMALYMPAIIQGAFIEMRKCEVEIRQQPTVGRSLSYRRCRSASRYTMQRNTSQDSFDDDV